MFGRNVVEKPVFLAAKDGALSVQEIFYTIQGEGPYAGMPAVFIRLAGCNLRCHFCDTDFESHARPWTQRDIINEVQRLLPEPTRAHLRPLIVLTGGEPCRQPIGALLVELVDQLGYRVQIETAGTLWPRAMEERHLLRGDVVLVCSPKTKQVHDDIERYCRDWKYIISVRDEHHPMTGLPTSSTQVKGESSTLFVPPWHKRPGDTIWVQPCAEYYEIDLLDRRVAIHLDADETMRNVNLCVELAMKFGYRVSLQTHKIMGLP